MSTNAVAALIEALQDREAKVRLGAAETLVKAGEQKNDDALVRTLTELMENTNSLIRLRAVDCVGRLGASAGILSDRLSKATNDNFGLVRVRARQALTEIGDDAAPKDKVRESF
jgi:HEAT repeat protein